MFFYMLAKRLLILLGCCLCTSQVVAQNMAELKNIRIGQHPDKIRLVIELSSSTPFVIFALNNPSRLMIGLEKATTTLQDKIIKQSFLQQISYYRDNNGLYAVINLNTPAWITGSEFIPPSSNNPARLVLDVSSISDSQFQQIITTGLTISSTNKPSLVGFKHWTSLNAKPYTLWFDEIGLPPFKPQQSYQQIESATKMVVVLDAGHGGIDSGAIGVKGTEEKKITLDLVKRLKKLLENDPKYQIYLTREDDRFLSLGERINFARSVKADLFISFHADSHGDSSLAGVSVYTLSDKASDAEAQVLANKENKSDIIGGVTWSEQNPEINAILIDLLQHETNTRSVLFANFLLKELGKKVVLLRNSHRSAGFLVLRAVDVPSVLIEGGYLSNAREETLLNTAEHQDKLAKAIYQAIYQYHQWLYQSLLGN